MLLTNKNINKPHVMCPIRATYNWTKLQSSITLYQLYSAAINQISYKIASSSVDRNSSAEDRVYP
jgi:hypothetical protein